MQHSGEENPTLLLMAGLPGAGKTTLTLDTTRPLEELISDALSFLVS